MDFADFPLLAWIGQHERRSKNASIATSGVVALPLDQIPFDLKKIDMLVPNIDGHLGLIEQLCGIYGADPSCIQETTGASEANFLALSVLANRGDRVVMETPTYGSLPAIAQTLGLKVVPLERSFRRGFALDLEALKKAARKGTKLVVLTNLHNPSGVAIPRNTLRAALEIAQDAGALLYVDETFREFGEGIPSAAEFEGPAVVTSTVSKVYGIGWTRVGWMVTPDAKTTMRIRRARRLVVGAGSLVGGTVAAWALRERARFVARAKAIVAENYRILDAWLQATPGITLVPPDGGSVCFPKVTLPKGTTGMQLAVSLLEREGILTTPGELFDRPGHFRIGCCGEPEKTAQALESFAAALGGRPAANGPAR
jgi:hypothetical protein